MPVSKLNSNLSKEFNDKTVLLIDDEKLVIEICEMMLQRLGHKVFKAYSGLEALKIFEDYKNQIDLVIIDMYMPEINGQELTVTTGSVKQFTFYRAAQHTCFSLKYFTTISGRL